MLALLVVSAAFTPSMHVLPSVPTRTTAPAMSMDGTNARRAALAGLAGVAASIPSGAHALSQEAKDQMGQQMNDLVGFPVADYLPLLGVGILAFNAVQMFQADAKSGNQYGAKGCVTGDYEQMAVERQQATQVTSDSEAAKESDDA
jgi:hypothetical protein